MSSGFKTVHENDSTSAIGGELNVTSSVIGQSATAAFKKSLTTAIKRHQTMRVKLGMKPLKMTIQ